ncbi:MAG: CbiX/SirB N-terminal domain-containing protein [Nocardioides sp.]
MGGGGGVTVLITVAHGTRHAPGNAVAAEITVRAGSLLGLPAVASYVELCEPSFVSVMAGLDGPAVVVPMLLSTGFHVRVDLPAAVAGASASVSLGPPLGPDPLLAAAQVARMVESGAHAGQPLVMVAAGSSEPDALTDLERAAAHLAEAWGGPVRLATLSGRGARPADVVRAGDAVSPYLLAPGFFADRVRSESLAVAPVVVAGVIGGHRAVVELVATRAAAL